jgi:hypothetical protein
VITTLNRAVTTFWVLATGVQIVVWIMIMIIGRHLQEPWWLWTALPGAALTAGLRWLAGHEAKADQR